MNRKALINAVVVGTIGQLAMVLAGHWVAGIQPLYPILGTLISLVAGVLYARTVKGSWGDSLLGGALAGGLCALIGIAVSVLLKDTETNILLFGTGASAFGGVIGGAIGKLLAR